MEQIEKKTTILLPKSLYGKLIRLSKITKKSMGQLLRESAEKQYFSVPSPEKVEIVKKMSLMKIPVRSPKEIASEILRGRLDF